MSEPLPPGPSAPKLMQLWQFVHDPHDLLVRCQARFGDAFTLRMPGQPEQVVVSDPRIVKQVVTSGYAQVERSGLDILRLLIDDHSVILQDGDTHRETRKILHAPLHGSQLRGYGDQMIELVDRRLATWGDRERRLLHDDMQDLMLDLILRCVFGVEGSDQLTTLHHLARELMARLFSPLFLIASTMFEPNKVRQYLRTRGNPEGPSSWRPVQGTADRMAAIDATIFELIRRCRELSPSELAGRGDILALLVRTPLASGETMSNEALRDHLLTLLVAGFETSANALCWAFDCALRNPGVMARVYDEARSTSDHSDAGRATSLRFIAATIKESMRLFPIAFALPRKTKQPLDIGRWTLPEGTLVMASMFHIHRDPRVWDDPEAFLPERFLERKPSVYEFFPYGSSVWSCLGAQFADLAMRVVVARIALQFDLEEAPGRKYTRPVLRGAFSPRDKLPVTVSRRVARSERTHFSFVPHSEHAPANAQPRT